ncbi:MAG: chemotaxis protein CheD [Lysobacterales bacterium CG17_big_fil_post_rev_8_21_14_2_50_64_11]|nr:MAG: chemotaxis protein CheD [Xanthomonadales bacterium CG17_big_fil_post_rev_8_21_14_2_50_64_11]PIX60049.1 MAG: chemotaxis protein CheD [Xanthomonadales bacterium CG_4_10_14_3_um_filter_64_11]
MTRIPAIAAVKPLSGRSTSALPGFDPALAQPGFAHVNRYFDPLLNHVVVKILPGEFYVTTQGEAVVTVLGSCVSACIRDRRKGIGGMNHFMLPESFATEAAHANGRAERYGNIAMEQLINSLLKAGADRSQLEVKVFGGGRVLAQMTDIGMRNIAFVRHYLQVENLAVAAEDLGDIHPRHVQYFPATGKVRVRQLRSLHNDTIVVRERSYLDKLKADPIAGEVEIFGGVS